MLDYVRSDIERLISVYERTRSENVSIRAELEQCKVRLDDYRKQIIELERQIDNLKLRSAFQSSAGDAEAKVKIDRLIRDIDRCISLLEG